jgi:hypothetical protein
MKPHRFQIEEERQRMMLLKFIGARPLPFQCEVGELREPRSLPQNSRLWALHQLASQATGYAPDELHELMLCKFFGTKTMEVGGVRRDVPLKRSSARDKQEFREFLDNVETFYASQLGVWLGKDE